MCKCLNEFPSWKTLVKEFTDEVQELWESKFLDQKEWSDVGRGFERFIEKLVGKRDVINLGGGLNRQVQKERLLLHGCIRSPRLVTANGGRCLSE